MGRWTKRDAVPLWKTFCSPQAAGQADLLECPLSTHSEQVQRHLCWGTWVGQKLKGQSEPSWVLGRVRIRAGREDHSLSGRGGAKGLPKEGGGCRSLGMKGAGGSRDRSRQHQKMLQEPKCRTKLCVVVSKCDGGIEVCW